MDIVKDDQSNLKRKNIWGRKRYLKIYSCPRPNFSFYSILKIEKIFQVLILTTVASDPVHTV